MIAFANSMADPVFASVTRPLMEGAVVWPVCSPFQQPDNSQMPDRREECAKLP